MIIRISIAEDKQIDWTVPSTETITFSDVLDAIYQASDDQLIVTAFDYMDEEDDVITVKNDDDLHSMIQFHLSNAHQSSSQFISIYPKLCKNPGKRNKFGLKVSISQPVRVTTNHASHRNTRPTVGQPASSLGELNRTTQAVENIKPEHHGDLVDGKPGVKPAPPASEIESLSNLAFTFIQTLGNGNSGVVYKVNHKSTNMTMAVKSIGIDLTGQEQDSIKSELAILSRCNSSPQIIDFYGAYFDENRIYLCTEYMDGGSLDRYGRIPEAVLKRVCYRVVSGLKFLWDERIMHRDVKPSNMLVNTRGQVKLCDFGVSRQLVNSIAQTYIGTNAYMAPERVVGFEYTIYSDIWSLGLSICEMATGHFPYPELANKIKGSHGVVPMEVMQCIVNDAPPRLPECGYSAEIMDFVKGCLQKEAGSRLSPKELSDHNFVKIDSFSDYEDRVIAEWVLEKASLIAE